MCVDRCPFDAITLKDNKAKVDPDKCYGCGVCSITCPAEAIKLHREERNELFKNPAVLQNTIYRDNRESN
ncbi:MAG: 4Fe-4S dicluster domain-containing protein [Promethearchaeota archaeon]|nr:MAG: 4Fe-4S dicluster domain-containing protein [Candidatus Lokiarchaeota archaeon]